MATTQYGVGISINLKLNWQLFWPPLHHLFRLQFQSLSPDTDVVVVLVVAVLAGELAADRSHLP